MLTGSVEILLMLVSEHTSATMTTGHFLASNLKHHTQNSSWYSAKK